MRGRAPTWRKRRPLADRILKWTGAAVIVVVALVGVYTAFLIGDFLAVTVILSLVLATGALFSRRLG